MNEEQLGARLLLENEFVRVWDDRVAEGATQHVHTHRRPYLAVVVLGECAETVDAEGRVMRTFESLRPGETFFFGPDSLPITHALRNTGSSEISVVIVEFL